jgi:aspartate racemase
MKKIGLVGGTGWVSTIEYYRIINEQVGKIRGGLSSAECILYSVNYEEINQLNLNRDDESVYQVIRNAALAVSNAGAKSLFLCANTLHRYAERLEPEVNIPVIHIADVTAKAINMKGINRIGLLGTRPTMELDFYRKHLEEAGISMLIPEKEDRDFIQKASDEELMKGVFWPGTKKRFLSITGQLRAAGAAGIVLGCTEIPLLISQADLSVPVFNTLEIHARAAADECLSEE